MPTTFYDNPQFYDDGTLYGQTQESLEVAALTGFGYSDDFYDNSVYYDDVFYGSGAAYNSTDVPQDLQWYRTETDGVYVFHWTFSPLFMTPFFSSYSLDWELQLDTVNTFNSPNLQVFTKTTAPEFYEGNSCKGYRINVPARQEHVDQTWYARVRNVYGSTKSAFSSIITWDIPPLFIDTSAEELLGLFTADQNVYNKEVLKLPISQRDTNLYSVVYKMYGQQFDYLKYRNILLASDNYLQQSQDSVLYENFGAFFNFQQPVGMANIQYRRILQNMFRASLVGGTISSIEQAVIGFTGIPPIIENVRDQLGFFIFNSQSNPNTAYLNPNNPPFLVSKSAARAGVVIYIRNPAQFDLVLSQIEQLVQQMLPAHVYAQYQIVDSQNVTV